MENLQEAFGRHYHKVTSAVYFCPGRVNLIGEHIDYNGGLVLPCAIDHGTYLLIARNDDQVFRLKSLNFPEEYVGKVSSTTLKDNDYWHNYPIGIAKAFARKGIRLAGLDMLFYGNLPIGAGLSSSASIAIATAFALNEIYNAGFSKLELVSMSKQVENEFIGVNSGIMDQFAVAFGAEDKAIKLNCDTLAYELVDCNFEGHVLAVINTNKPRRLSESKYNERVAECQAALKALQKAIKLDFLCDINTATFNLYQHLISDQLIRNRARHVIGENERVKLAVEALKNNRIKSFGKYLYNSHDSLKNLYDVSCPELDCIVDYCLTCKEVLGARMTGAGFGGCAIALVKQSAFESFSNTLTEHYREQIGYEPSVYAFSLSDGVYQYPNKFTVKDELIELHSFR